MLDVLHYLFEEDATYDYNEQVEHKSRMRSIVYETLYKTDYAYKNAAQREMVDEFGESMSMSPDIDREVKPYIPPTQFNPDAPNPFGAALRERPLG